MLKMQEENPENYQKKLSFLETDPNNSKFSLEKSIRFLFDNIDEQILWLEEKTLIDKKDKITIQRERLLTKVFLQMFEIFDPFIGKLKSLDLVCQKNLFSYIRLKNKNLGGDSEIQDGNQIFYF